MGAAKIFSIFSLCLLMRSARCIYKRIYVIKLGGADVYVDFIQIHIICGKQIFNIPQGWPVAANELFM